MGQGDRVMPGAGRIVPAGAPPRILEAVAGFLTPPVYREVVLGDLRERYLSPMHYISDAWYTVPCVVYSRIRRTADPGVLLMDSMLLYVSFLAAAWQFDRELIYDRLGLLRLAIPVMATVIALMFGDAYARPGKRSPLRPLMQATLGVGFACFAQSAFSVARFACALPWWIMIVGGGFGVIAISTVGMLFPPSDDRPRGAG